MYGREARLPVDVEHLVVQSLDQDISQNDVNSVIQFMEQMDTMRSAVFDSMRKNIKTPWNSKRHPTTGAILPISSLSMIAYCGKISYDMIAKGASSLSDGLALTKSQKCVGKTYTYSKASKVYSRKKQNGVNLKSFKESPSTQSAATLQ